VDEAAGTVEFTVDVRHMRVLDPFDFYLDHYKQQLVAGDTKETPSFGLRVLMHDFNKLARMKAVSTSKSQITW